MIWKVYMPGNSNIQASCLLAADALAICMRHGSGIVKVNGRVVWRHAEEMINAQINPVGIMLERKNEHDRQAHNKYQAAIEAHSKELAAETPKNRSLRILATMDKDWITCPKCSGKMLGTNPSGHRCVVSLK